MSITTEKFKGAAPATLIKIQNQAGSVLTLTDLGAAIVSIEVPSRTGDLCHVALGYEGSDEYLADDKYLGATVGRYANRIAGGELVIDGVTYSLDKNQDGKHTLHGGSDGWHTRIWRYTIDERKDSVTFSLHSPDMDQGFPGNADIDVTYTLTDNHIVRILYRAVSDKDTVFNLTNHNYFNLSGKNSGKITDHLIHINASRFTVVDADAIPTGELRDVKGSALDLTGSIMKKVGDGIDADEEQIVLGHGYDHNFVINGAFDDGSYKKGIRDAAAVKSDVTGIMMTVRTDLPGIQLYTGNFLGTGSDEKSGGAYEWRSGLCLETQFFPDSPHFSNFPSVFFKAGEVFQSVTEYEFSTDKASIGDVVGTIAGEIVGGAIEIGASVLGAV